MSSDERDEFQINLPQTELQFQFSVTENTWGSNEVNPELRNAMTEVTYALDSQGNIKKDKLGKEVVLQERLLWDRFSLYRRDLRLGNLNDDELRYCQQYMDVAFQCLQMDWYQSAAIALGYVATMIELSQSKRGFLRRLWNTLTQRSVNITEEPGRRGFFGGKKKQEA